MTLAPGLLAVFAHPDDEAFGVAGVLARAVEAGARVTVVCATRGEVGEISDLALASAETLGAVREGELRAACRELGVEEVYFLGYRDSGMAGTPENDDPRCLHRADPDEVVARLVRLVRELRPHVVITFEPGGGYGHPDHVAVSRHTTVAFDLAGDPRALAEAGPPHRPARLYYTAIPRGLLRELAERARAAGLEVGPFRDQDLDRLGVPDREITAAVDVSPWLDKKRRALAAHATQVGPNDPLHLLPDEWRDRLLGREHFVLARGEGGEAARDDLLAGLGNSDPARQ
ncbi:MAG: PIG-L family deacetylase [Chloroflexi bacterium]|nr:PIG-L family deacetylase [Chloroflexota bacterium]